MTQTQPDTDSTATGATSGGAHADHEKNQHADAQRTVSARSKTDADGQDLPLDKVFDILQNSRRRRAIAYLQANDGEATLSDVAEHIAAIEHDVSVEALTSEQRKRVYIGLYQCHLPRMDDMRIVEFDKHRGTVELTANADQLTRYVEPSHTRAWPLLYGSVAVAGFGLLGLSTVNGVPAPLTPTTTGLVVLLVVALCSAVHAYIELDSIRGLVAER